MSDPSGTAGETRVLTTDDPASQTQVLERGSNGGFALREFTSAEVEAGRSETRRANAAKAKQIEKSLQRPSERYLDNAQRNARIRGRVQKGLPLHPAVGDGKSRGRTENTDADGNYSAYMQGVIASEAANGPHPRMSPGPAGHLTEGIVQDGGEVGDKVAGVFFGAALMKGGFLGKAPRPSPVSAVGEIEVPRQTRADFAGEASAAVAKNKPKVRVGAPVEASAAAGGGVPRGFSDAAQFKQAGTELAAALDEAGVAYSRIGVRGSSVTGASSKGGPFRTAASEGKPASDIDVFIEFADDVGLSSSKNIPGFVHPNKLMKRYPGLQRWAEKWSGVLGREITPGGFKPGTFTDPNYVGF